MEPLREGQRRKQERPKRLGRKLTEGLIRGRLSLVVVLGLVNTENPNYFYSCCNSKTVFVPYCVCKALYLLHMQPRSVIIQKKFPSA